MEKHRNVGFLCHYVFGNGSAQYVFLDVGNDGAASLNPSLCFSLLTSAHVCASCNGMILLSRNLTGEDNLLSFHVFDITARRSVALPQLPHTTTTPPRIITHGLAFDGLHYHVVLVFSSRIEQQSTTSTGTDAAGGIIEMEIFSSETGKWRHHTTMIPLPPYLPKLSTPPLYFNGSIYWELGGFLLIHNIQNSYSELLQLPNHSWTWSWRSMTFGQCLWESEGRVHYCYTDYQGIHSWALMNQQDHDDYINYYNLNGIRFKWKLAHTVPHHIIPSQNSRLFLNLDQTTQAGGSRHFSEWKPYYVSPSAYSEASHTLFLRLPGILAAYNLRTQALKEVCNYSFPGDNFYCCSFCPIVYGERENSVMEDIEFGGEREVVISLPLADTLVCSLSKPEVS